WQSVAGAFARAAGARGGPAWTMAPSTPTCPPPRGGEESHMKRTFPSRHPELVSGPIAPHSRGFRQNRPKLARPRGEVAPRPEAPSRASKWALKQVQGDEFGGAGAHCDPPALKGRLALRSKANGV